MIVPVLTSSTVDGSICPLKMIISCAIFIPSLAKAPIRNAGIVVQGDRIVSAGRADHLIRKYPRHPKIVFPDAVLLPGLVNLHTHLELPPLLGSIRASRLPGWILNLIQAKKELKPSDYKAAACTNIRDLIKTGTTTVAEICTHDASPAFLKRAGLRSVIYREVISMNPDPGNRPALTGPRSSQLIRYGISPHSPYTVSEGMLRKIQSLSRFKNIGVCMHVGESKDEINLLQGKTSGFEKLYQKAGWDRSWAPSADSPFEYLARLGLLGPRFLAVHAVHANDRDLTIIKKSGAPVVHCPRSNRNTHAGRMPLWKFIKAGINVGIGTDSLASSTSLNMWDEMRYAYKIHERDGIAPQDIFAMATINGAKALDLGASIGSLEPGKKADCIAVPLPAKDTGDIYSDLLRETKSCIMAMVNGKIIYKGNRS